MLISNKALLRSTLSCWLTSLLLTAACVRIPRQTLGTDVDSSWCSVLEFARQHGLQFGSDLVFTYGPLGFLVMPCYSSESTIMQMAFSAVLCFIIVSGFCLLIWRTPLLWRLFSLVAFSCVALNLHAGVDFWLNIGLLCWGLFSLQGSGRQLPFFLLCFTVLAIIGSLAKVSFLFAALATVAVVVLDLGFRRRPLLALGALIFFFGGLVLGWELLGQKLRHLPAFVAQGWEFSTWYPRTMSKPAVALIKWNGFIILGASIIVIALRNVTVVTQPAERWRKIMLVAWLEFFLFFSWKHGMVRLDEYHIELFAGFVILSFLALETLVDEFSLVRIWARGGSILCCVLAFFLLIKFFDLSPASYFVFRPWERLVTNVRILTNPSGSLQQFGQSHETQQSLAQLPQTKRHVGTNAIDVFGNEQAYAVFNDFQYQPRPVFQSYAAYSDKLMRLNQGFYASSRAPELILFRVAAIDHRFPPLEDAKLFPILLNNCDLLEHEGRFLLLRRTNASYPKLRLTESGTGSLGTPINLRQYGKTNLWVEFEVSTSAAGKIHELVYKTSALRLSVYRGPSKSVAHFNAPAPMLAAGFLASPILLRNEDLLDFYSDSLLTRPEAYSLACPPGEEYFWDKKMVFRIYTFDSRSRAQPKTDSQ